MLILHKLYLVKSWKFQIQHHIYQYRLHCHFHVQISYQSFSFVELFSFYKFIGIHWLHLGMSNVMSCALAVFLKELLIRKSKVFFFSPWLFCSNHSIWYQRVFNLQEFQYSSCTWFRILFIFVILSIRYFQIDENFNSYYLHTISPQCLSRELVFFLIHQYGFKEILGGCS